MSWFIPDRSFDPAVPEMMDRLDVDPDLLREDLANLRRINRYFGGRSTTRKSVLPLLERVPRDREITILDLATGSGDQAVELVRLGHIHHRSIRVTAVDKNPVMLSVARSFCRAYPEISIEEGDLLGLRYPERSFDIVHCSLALHHFSRNDSIAILRTMKSLSRLAVVVHDLNRSRMAAWAAWIYTHCTTRNPITLFDSYISTLRAFTPSELDMMAREAGFERRTIRRHPLFRLVLTAFTD